MIEQIKKLSWLAVEAGLVLVILCVILQIILGASSGSFISSVARNAMDFLQKIPSGTFLGLFLILGLYHFVKDKGKR